MPNFTTVKPIYELVTHVLPLVYDDTLSYMELVGKVCKKLNELVENNNQLPDYIANLIQNYITSGDIEKVLANVLANYMLNVQNPPDGLKPASGNGTADDTEAVQGCIDYACEHDGMCVYFPSGSYLVSSLTLKNKTSLFGFDRYATKLVLKGGAKTAMFSGSPDQISISGMTLDGNGDVQVNNVSIVDISVNSAEIRDCVLTDGYTLLKINVSDNLQCDNLLLDHSIVSGCDLSGNGRVQFNNIIFGSVSRTSGEFYLNNACSNSLFSNICFVGVAPLAINNTGDHNEFYYHAPGTFTEFNDDGKYNVFRSATRNVDSKLSGRAELSVKGTISVECDDSYNENIGGTKTSVTNGNVSTRSVGTTTVQSDKKFTGIFKQGVENTVTGNVIESVTGNKTVTTTGKETRSSGNLSETSGNVTKNYTTENVTATDRTVKSNSETHVVNGLRTESATNASDTVTGTVTEKYGTRTETETVNKTVVTPKMTETVNGLKTANYSTFVENVHNYKTTTASLITENTSGKDVECETISVTASYSADLSTNGSLTLTAKTFKLDSTSANMTLKSDTFPVKGKTKSVDILNPEIFTLPDVKHFGAKGTGDVDDSSAIQKSLDTQGCAIFPSGTYICNNVKIPSGGKVIGLGNATLKCTAGGGCCMMNKSNGTTGGYDATSNILVDGLDFTSDFPNVTATLLAFGHATNVTVRNCSFHDLREWHFIEINSCNHTVIDNCFFYNYGYTGYGFTEMVQLDYASSYDVFPFFTPYDSTTCNDVEIANCRFVGVKSLIGMYSGDARTPSGVGNHTSGNEKITNVNIHDCWFSDLATATKFVTASSLRFHHNRVINCRGGLYFNGYTNNIDIDNNRMTGDFNYQNIEYNRGISVYLGNYSSNVNISDNDISGFGGHGITPQGLLVNLIGNVVRGCGMHGIYVGYQNFGMYVNGNVCYSNNMLNDSNNPRYDINVVFTRGDVASTQTIGDIVVSNNKCNSLTTSASSTGDNNFSPIIVDQNFCKNILNKSSQTSIFKFGTNWVNFTKS